MSGGGRVTEGWRPCGEAVGEGASEVEEAMMILYDVSFLSDTPTVALGAPSTAQKSPTVSYGRLGGERQGD